MMKQTLLGQTGISVSPLCIGAWQLGGPLFFDGKPDGHPDPGREQVINMIRALGERGINHIDTAEQYSAGESERRVGEAIRGRRDRWVVSTKFGFRVGPDQTRIDDASPPTIMPSLEGSLKRLGTDYIDVYLFHCEPLVEDLDASREILEKAKADGKIRAYGISTNNEGLAMEMANKAMLDVLQFHANLLEPFENLTRLCVDKGIGTQVRGVMAQGRLSGKYFDKAPVWRGDDNRSRHFRDHDFTRYAVLQNVIPEGWTMAQAAIRWILDDPGHHTICLGAKNLQDYETALAALELPPLSPETRKAMRETAMGIAG